MRGKRCIIVLLIVSFLFSTTGAQALPMFKYGIIDTSGHEVLPCKYGDVWYLGNGLFRAVDFMNDGETGVPRTHLFDSNGKEIEIKLPEGSSLLGIFIPRRALMSPAYVPGTLPEGTLFEVHYRNYQSVTDRNGKLLFENPSLSIQHSQDGSLVVMGASDPICAFDGETGERVIEAGRLKRYMLSQSGFGKLSQNRISFSRDVDGHLLWGYYDAEGSVAIEPKYTDARDFDDAGMAAVRYRNAEQKGRFCFIDTDGKTLSPPEMVGAEDWHDGLAVVAVRSGDKEKRYGIVNRNFEFVVKPEWASLEYAQDDCYFGWKTESTDAMLIDGNGNRKSGPFLKLTTHDRSRAMMLYKPLQFGPLNAVPAKLIMESGETLFSNPRFLAYWLENGVAVFREQAHFLSRGPSNFTIVTNKGVTATGVNAYDLAPATQDRLIKHVVSGQFCSRTWQSDARARRYLFSLFLREHTLIGMQRSEVQKYLGATDHNDLYAMCPGVLMAFGEGLELRYLDDRVTGWRWVKFVNGEAKYLPWNDTNVL
jgi:hypothetical protein